MQTEQIQKVVMTDAGIMGTSMAQIFVAHGYGTVLYNHRGVTLQRACRMVELNQEALVLSGELSQAEPDAVKTRIQLTPDEFCSQDYDVVVEPIVESTRAKHQPWWKISDLTHEGVTLTINTSGFSITEIAKAVQRSERFYGVYWFNPPHLVPLVGVVKGEKAGDQTARVVVELAGRIGKKAVTVKKDAKGFIDNRLQTAILREALHITQSGIVDAGDVDKTVKYGIEFRYACLGPLETADFDGLNIFYHAAEYLVLDLYSSQEVSALLWEKFEEGELDVRTGKGFYDYSGDKGGQVIRERGEKSIRLYHALYQKR